MKHKTEAPEGISTGWVQDPNESTVRKPTIKTELITFLKKLKKGITGIFLTQNCVWGSPLEKACGGVVLLWIKSHFIQLIKSLLFWKPFDVERTLQNVCEQPSGTREEPSKFHLNDRELSFSVNKLSCQIPSKKNVCRLSPEPGAGLRTGILHSLAS